MLQMFPYMFSFCKGDVHVQVTFSADACFFPEFKIRVYFQLWIEMKV